jgi:hypothetical protein
MTDDLLSKARALAEAVLKEYADLDNPCDDAERCGCAESLARALLAALDAEPQRLDRERLAALICSWNEGDTAHQPTEEEVSLADFILARLEGRDSK